MHPITYTVLAVLHEGPADGNEILARLEAVSGGEIPSLPTLYRCLREGMAAGWIEASEATPTAGRGRPPQRYRATDLGLEAARAEARRLRSLAALALGERSSHGGGR